MCINVWWRAVNLHSKDEWVRGEALCALERLAARCRQPAAARALLTHAFAEYNGASGKLTSSEDKIAVLNVSCILHYYTAISSWYSEEDDEDIVNFLYWLTPLSSFVIKFFTTFCQ